MKMVTKHQRLQTPSMSTMHPAPWRNIDAPSRNWKDTTREPTTHPAIVTIRPKTTQKWKNWYRTTRRWPASPSTPRSPEVATLPRYEQPTSSSRQKYLFTWWASPAALILKSSYCRIYWIMHTLPHHFTFARHRLRWNSRTWKAYCYSETERLKLSIYSHNENVMFSVFHFCMQIPKRIVFIYGVLQYQNLFFNEWRSNT